MPSHLIPLNRLVTAENLDNNIDLNYDREKYKEMLLEAAETVLGIFEFDPSVYGRKPKDKKWWMVLRRNRINDVRAETDMG